MIQENHIATILRGRRERLGRPTLRLSSVSFRRLKGCAHRSSARLERMRRMSDLKLE